MQTRTTVVESKREAMEHSAIYGIEICFNSFITHRSNGKGTNATRGPMDSWKVTHLFQDKVPFYFIYLFIFFGACELP